MQRQTIPATLCRRTYIAFISSFTELVPSSTTGTQNHTG
jgi:hypothetical protein